MSIGKILFALAAVCVLSLALVGTDGVLNEVPPVARPSPLKKIYLSDDSFVDLVSKGDWIIVV